jgi:hypothetical protein
MADDEQKPGPYSISITEGDPYQRTLTFTDDDDELLVLPTTGWRGQIRRRPDKNAELVDSFTIDASQAGVGLVTVTLPALPVGVYFHDIECVGVRTFLAGSVKIAEQVSDDD